MVESTAANPQLLADQVSTLLVQPLEAVSVVLSSGPRIFDTAAATGSWRSSPPTPPATPRMARYTHRP